MQYLTSSCTACLGRKIVGGVGGATLATVRAYVDAQGTEEHARKNGKALKEAPFARLHPGLRPKWGMRSQWFNYFFISVCFYESN
ncbi:hypothetical protein MCERE10_00564 [Burkholderiaceae bacterium]